MRFSILGPTQVRRADGREVTVGGPRLRALLALLLVDAGNVVAAERLIDGLYGGNPPGDAANALASPGAHHRTRPWGFASATAAAAAEGLAGVALLEGDGEQAALLLGVGAAVRGAPVAGDPDVARVQVAARARIGEAAYQQAWQRGAAMPRDQALSLLGAPPSASGA